MRKRYVTRTIKSRTVTVLGLDTETAEPMNKATIYTPPIDDPYKELIHVKSLLETDTFVVAKIVDRVDSEEVFGMPEEEFLKMAKPMPRGKTETNTEEA